MLPPIMCTPCEPCCTTLSSLADAVLEVAQDGLSDCTDCCGAIPGFVTVGPFISRPDGDYLAVWLAEIKTSGRTDFRGSILGNLAVATFSFKLMETGWPWPANEERTITLPDPTTVHTAARHSMAHAESVFRALFDAALRSRFGCGYRQMVPLVPVQPAGGMVGWTGGIQFDVEF